MTRDIRLHEARTTLPPPGFEPLCATSPFMNRVSSLFVHRDADGIQTIGSMISQGQLNSQGSAHGGFLLSFADFALSTATGSTLLTVSVEFLRPARIGQWIQARVTVRKASASLIFADAIVTCEHLDILRAGGIFRPAGGAAKSS